MKAFFVAGVMMFSATTAFCQDWTNITSSEEREYDGRRGTREFGSTKAGTPVTIAQGRVFDLKAKSYRYEKWYVTVADCKAGYGKLVVTTMSGDFSFEAEYVTKGGSVSSQIGDMLCYPVKEQIGKGV